jgi:hypothetical protein
MKNKILWICFNISLSITLLSWLIMELLNITLDIVLVFFLVGITFTTLSIVNFFILNIDWSKTTEFWKDLGESSKESK